MSARWFALDVLFLSNPHVAHLGDRFGPAGPLALIHMIGTAKILDEGGRFTISYRNLARGAFLRSGAQARDIVAEATERGLLELISIDKEGFVGSFPDWDQWQRTDAKAAERMRRYRAKRNAGDPTVTSRVTSPVTNVTAVQPQETEDRTAPTSTEDQPQRVVDLLATVQWPGGEVSREKVETVISAFPKDDHLAAACLAANWRESPTFRTEQAHVALRAALQRNRDRVKDKPEENRAAKVYDLRTTCRDCGKQLAQAERSTGRCDPCFEAYSEKVLGEDGAA